MIDFRNQNLLSRLTTLLVKYTPGYQLTIRSFEHAGLC